MMTKIDSAIWDDIGELSCEEKVVVFWLLTSRVDSVGFVEVKPRVLTFETGCSLEQVEGVCKGLPRGFVRTQTGVWMRNYIRRQFSTGESLKRDNMRFTLRKHLEMVPAEVAKMVLKEYPELKATGEGKGSSKNNPSHTPPSPPAKGEREGEGEGEGEKGIAKGIEPEPPEVWLDIDECLPMLNIALGRPRLQFWSNRETTAINAFLEDSSLRKSDIDAIEAFYAAAPDYTDPKSFERIPDGSLLRMRKRTALNVLEDFANQTTLARRWAGMGKKKKGGGDSGPPAVPEPAANWRADARCPKVLQSGTWAELPRELQLELNPPQAAEA